MSFASVAGFLLVKPALVVGAAALLAVCLRRQSAALRHVLWVGAIVAIIGLPFASLTLPPLRVQVPDRALAEAPWIRPALRADRPTAAPTPATSVSTPSSGSAPGRAPADLLIAVWGLGALFLLTRRAAAELSARRLVRRSTPSRDPRLSGVISPVVVSREISSPAVAGVLRPVIILPASLLEDTSAELSQILAHELGHLTRRDCLWNLIADLATAVYWCNPLVWLAARRVRSESERACDDRVLAEGGEPEAYAHLLLSLARRVQTGNLPRAATAMARPRELESRLLAVMDPRVRRGRAPAWQRLGLAAAVLFLALPVGAVTLQAANVPSQGEPDRRADALAGPGSERVMPLPDPARVESGRRDALAGPDSSLARVLAEGLGRVPTGAEDLVSERAAWALAQASGGQLIEPLLLALDAPDWRIRAYAAWTLSISGDPRATGRLVPLLSHPVWRLRAMVTHALAAIADPAVASAMEPMLLDPAWQVRTEAVEYFAALGKPDLIAPRLRDRHMAVRSAAERALTSR